MRTVRGWVTSKEPVSLKKAARIVSSFAARDNFASQDVTNYLKRAAVSFNELLRFHRELRQGRKPGSFRSYDATADDGEPSARNQDAGETRPGVGGKESRKEKKLDKSGGKPTVGGGDKFGILVDGASELLDVEESKGKGRKSIVAGEVVEVRKFAGKGGKLIMDVAVEGIVKVAVEDNGEKARVDGGDEERSKERRKEKRKNRELNKEKMNSREQGKEQSKKEEIKNREEGDEQSKKEKKKKKEEIEEHSKKEKEKRKNREEGQQQNKIEKNSEAEAEQNKIQKRKSEAQKGQNKIEKRKRKNSEAEEEQNKKKKRIHE